MLRFSLELNNPPESILGYPEFADRRNRPNQKFERAKQSIVYRPHSDSYLLLRALPSDRLEFPLAKAQVF